MCHHPASASAGIASAWAKAGNGTGAVASACSASAANPEIVRWVIKPGESSTSARSAHASSALRSRASGRQRDARQRRVPRRAAGRDGAAGWRSECARARPPVWASGGGRAPWQSGAAHAARGRADGATGRRTGEEAVEQRAAVLAGKRPVGNAPRRRVDPAVQQSGALLGRRVAGRLAQQVEQRFGQRPRPRRARRWMPAAPCGGPGVSGSSPAGSARSAGCGRARACGSASSAARAAARLPAASPSKHRIGAGDEPPQLLELLLGQRRAERGDGAAETRLMQRDHVHVAFDHHQRRAAAAPPRGPGRARRALRRLENSAVSGPLTYFGWPSPRVRPPKLMIRPRRSRIGNITRLKNRSRARPVSCVGPHQPGLDEQVRGSIPSRPDRRRARPGPRRTSRGRSARIVASVRPRPSEVVERRGGPPAGTAAAGSWRLRRLEHARPGRAAAARPRRPAARASAPPARPRRRGAPPPR